MVEVEAIRGFVHGGRRMIGDRFDVSPREASLLASKSLVMILGADDPPVPAAGERQPASPAAPVSPNPIAEPRKRGRPRKTVAG